MKKMHLAFTLALILVFTAGCQGEPKSKVTIPKITQNEELLIDASGQYAKIFEIKAPGMSSMTINTEVWHRGQKVVDNVFNQGEMDEYKLVLAYWDEKNDKDENIGFNWRILKEYNGIKLKSKTFTYSYPHGQVATGWSLNPDMKEDEKSFELKPDSEYILAGMNIDLDGKGISSFDLGEVKDGQRNINDEIKDQEAILILRIKTGSAK
ncbi:hypothetical protein [Microaceticoccus formicicus]|uniref:hypothetical protein n=1 Tax=Microaceticoccus formicicus TaxID=3118105 RepID=UPI003CD01259|nr:hypothetical protein VZL98_00450 [Peptoniphilaceae bacterium AMB_02]